MKRRTQYGPPLDQESHLAAYYHAWTVLYPMVAGTPYRNPNFTASPDPIKGFEVPLTCMDGSKVYARFNVTHGFLMRFNFSRSSFVEPRCSEKIDHTYFRQMRHIRNVSKRLSHFIKNISSHQKNIFTSPLTFQSVTILTAALTHENNT